MGFLSLGVEAMPSITSSSFGIASSQASHRSPLPAPPQNRGMLSYGSRPSLSFSWIRRRTGVGFQGGHNRRPNFYRCLVKSDHL